MLVIMKTKRQSERGCQLDYSRALRAQQFLALFPHHYRLKEFTPLAWQTVAGPFSRQSRRVQEHATPSSKQRRCAEFGDKMCCQFVKDAVSDDIHTVCRPALDQVSTQWTATCVDYALNELYCITQIPFSWIVAAQANQLSIKRPLPLCRVDNEVSAAEQFLVLLD